MSLNQMTSINIVDQADRLRDHRQWLEAAVLYGGALEQNQSSGPLWTQYAHMLKEGELFEEAASAYVSAVRCDGTAPDPRLHLAHLLKRLGRSAEALQAFGELSVLPHAPHVEQEMVGLEIQLMQTDQKAPAFGSSSQARPGLEACLSGFERLQRLEAIRIAEIAEKNRECEMRHAVRSSPFSELRHFRRGRLIPARLNPKANLVIRDGRYVATTENPQFSVVIDAHSLDPGWFEVEIDLLASASMSFNPVLYIEHRFEWAAFSIFRLKPLGGGRFGAAGFIESPVLSVRLDPANREGSFTVQAFELRQSSVARAFCQAYRQNQLAARKALRTTIMNKNGKRLAQDIADILKYTGPDRYHAWIALHDTPSSEKADLQRRAVLGWSTQPLISLIVDSADLSLPELDATLRSLKEQSYDSWQLHVVTSSTLSGERRHALVSRVETDPRMILEWEDGVSLAERLLRKCNGHFIIFVAAGDILAPSALYEIAKCSTTKPNARLIYSDEDSIDAGTRHSPLFKPDWDPDYFFASNYLGRFLAFEADLVAMCAPPQLMLRDLDTHELILRAIEILLPDEIDHIPRILYHRCLPHRGSVQNPLPDPMTPRRLHALSDSLMRRGKDVMVVEEKGGFARVIWPLPRPAPLVTLIIPTRDYLPLLKGCVESLLSNTNYPNFEIIVVDNDSVEPDTLRYFDVLNTIDNVRVLSAPGPFNFSKLNNLAVEQAKGSVIGLVNNDIVATESGWLQEMVSQATRPDVGAVGAKLLYRTGQVQHAGVVCGIGLVAGHPHKYRAGNDLGYMGRLAVTQSFSAVTAACLVVEKAKYHQVGGLDSENLQVAFNDVDFCLKLDEFGYRNIYTPYASLIHLESVTRGLDTSPEKTRRYEAEAQFMLTKWGSRIHDDPFYNVNLTADREDFSIRD